MADESKTGKPRKWLRRLAWSSGAVLALLAVFLLLTPFWLGLALKGLLPEGISIGHYERRGYTSFVLEEVRMEFPGLQGEASQAELLYPWTWLWRARQDRREEPYVAAGDIRLKIQPAPEPQEPKEGEVDLVALLRQIDQQLPVFAKWIPKATVRSVEVDLGEEVIQGSDLVWEAGTLAGHVGLAGNERLAGALRFEATQGPLWRLEVTNDPLGLAADAAFDLESGSLDLALDQAGNHLEMHAEFPPRGVLPNQATWRAEQWSLDLDDYGIAGPFEKVVVTLSGLWKDGQVDGELRGRAQARDDLARIWPELTFQADVRGNPSFAVVESLALDGRGANIVLRDPLEIDLEKWQLQGLVELEVDMNLAHWEVEGLAGHVSGQASLRANEELKPAGSLSLTGRGIRSGEIEIQAINLDGNLDWPMLAVERSEIVWREGVSILAQGLTDLQEQRVERASLTASLAADALQPFLPEGLALQTLDLEGEASGKWQSLSYGVRGKASGFKAPQLKALAGVFALQGEGADLRKLELEVSNGDLNARLVGGLAQDDEFLEISLSEFAISRGEGNALQLARPGSLRIGLQESGTRALADLGLGSDLAAVDLVADVAWPQRSKVIASIDNFDTETWVAPWLEGGMPHARIHMLRTEAVFGTPDGSATATLDVSHRAGEEDYRLAGRVEMDRQRIRFGQLALSKENEQLLSAEGDFPAPVDLETLGVRQLDVELPFSLQASTADNRLVSEALSRIVGYTFSDAAFALDLKGPLAQPQGDVSGSFTVTSRGGEASWPDLGVSVEAQVDGTRLDLGRLHVQSEKERFALNGWFELPEQAIRQALQGQVGEIDWPKFTYSLMLPNSSIAPLARLFPQYLAPTGKMEAEASGQGFDQWNGYVSVSGVNTRPLFPFGALRDIRTRILLEGQVVELSEFSGSIGLERVDVKGKADLERKLWNFTLKSRNTPLIRQAGLLLRSDMDLKIDGGLKEGTKVTGTVRPRDGILIMDTTKFVAPRGAGGKTAESRPPYFSVETEPLDDWDLDVAIKGDRFMKLETPAAEGILSIDMKLNGKLEEPWLQGELFFERGQLLFPFANFNIDQGIVDFRLEDPYEPVIQLSGSTRRFEYELGVMVTGNAFDPQVRFTSSPALSSDEILLMVMAGENPQDTVTYSATQRASKIGSYLSRGLLSSGTGEEGFGSRISISGGEALSEQGKETLDVEVRLTDRLFAVGEYDEYDAWNAGVRWRVLSNRKLLGMSAKEADEETEPKRRDRAADQNRQKKEAK